VEFASKHEKGPAIDNQLAGGFGLSQMWDRGMNHCGVGVGGFGTVVLGLHSVMSKED